jgi:hypothetical protein
VLLAAMALFTPWIMEQSSRSIDTAILEPLFGWRRVPSTFDLLFGFLVFTSLSLIAWTLRRLVAVWASLRQCLRHVDALPLGDAFERLPAAIAALARFTPFNAPADSAVNLTIDRAAYARWLDLRYVKDRLPDSIARWVPDRAGGAFPSLRSESARFDLSIAGPLIAMHRALVSAVRHDDIYLATMVSDPARSATRTPRPGGTVAPVQELVALYVIDYVEWVVRHLRQLAFYLIICLTLTMVFISSYPFAPASLIRVIFFTLMALSVIAIATILFQMNRNSTLSRIGHTTAGEITWDTQFILSLLLVTGVPLITIISAEFPGVRDFLFSWVTPALKAVAKT